MNTPSELELFWLEAIASAAKRVAEKAPHAFDCQLTPNSCDICSCGLHELKDALYRLGQLESRKVRGYES